MQIKKFIKKFTPDFLIYFYHYLWALLGAIVFGFPGKNLIIIGVTGTSGKSTTVDFITKILEEAGNKVVSNSSIRFKVSSKEWPNNLKMGMPGRFFMQKLLRQGVKAGCNYAVLEVTSEGIRQHRHKFINFDTAVFTNLNPEHIESHGGFENYRNEKLKLFKATKNLHIINADDENAKYFLEISSKKKILFSIKNNNRTMDSSMVLKAENIKRTYFEVNGVQFNLNLLGNFNVYNALAAISVAVNYKISLDVCKKALEKVKEIPGRMEIVSKEPLVIVDYAHTPDQLEKVYKTLTHQFINSSAHRLICVLGSCGGGRDKWKRPILGKIAEQYCSQIIITNEDPYDENPSQILSEIKSGISNTKFQSSNFYEILDRKKAIKKAIQLAKPEDTIIITGKGSESVMCVENGRKIPWDDRQITREVLIFEK